MLKPVPMLQMSVVVLERDKRAVLRDWGRVGRVQLLPREPGPETAPLPPRDRTGDLAHCEALLQRLEELRRSLQFPEPGEETAEPPEDSLPEAERKFGALEEQAKALLQRRDCLARRSGELRALSEQVSSYCGLELPLEEPGRFEFLHFITGSLPPENLEHLTIGDNVALLPLGKGKKRLPLIAMTTRQGRLALEKALQDAGFQPETLPAMEGATADTACEKSRREQEGIAAELQQVDTELRTLTTEAARPVATLARLARMERRLLEAERNAPCTEATVLLSGWIAAADVPALEQRLRKITRGQCVIETRAAEDVPEAEVPVLLRHPRWLRPFEMLVTAYGLPRYQELEPTLFVALSFVLMFGMMFGDAGQGAVLAISGLAALLAGRAPRVRDVGLLLLYGGLSSILFGVAYGSYFGLPRLKRYALWHDPVEGDPLDLMYSAIGLGIVLMSVGLILNVINRFRRRDVLGGFLDKFGLVGMLFYWGTLALIMRFAAFQSRGLVNLALLLFLALPIAGWTLKGPLEYVLRRRAHAPQESEGGLFAAGAESLVGAFEALLSYLANTISFVRLAAYAMSHAALLVATFMVAAQVQRASAAGGVLVIICGNLVALLLEGVIASVQALRLEYYEFFSKFFSGAGQAFKPFQLNA